MIGQPRATQRYEATEPDDKVGLTPAIHLAMPPAPEAIRVMPRDPGYAMLRQDLWLDLTPILI